MRSPLAALAALVPMALAAVLPAQFPCATGTEPGCICQPPSGAGAMRSQHLILDVADNITVGALPVVLNRLTWWGGYWRRNSLTLASLPCNPAVREFTITIYRSNEVLPGQEIVSFDCSEAVPESLTITPTNQTFSGIPGGTFVSHAFSCPTPRITLRAWTEYWIEIKAKATSRTPGMCMFVWEYSNTNAGAPGAAVFNYLPPSRFWPSPGAINEDFAWCIQTIPAASCTLRNGSGINPVDYTCVTTPVVGQNWQATIATNPNTVITFIAVGLAGPHPGFPFLGGEFLLQASRPIPRLVPGNGSYSIPIPPDAMDVIVHTQGIRVDDVGGVPTVVLLNAQRLVLGL